MHPMVTIALRAARDASTLILDAMGRPDRFRVFDKGANDFFTNVDKAVEEKLITLISKTYPDHSFHGEESGYREGKDKDILWVIDPIDGTRNFIHGYPHFCISIACVQKGRIEHALIIDPVRQEEFTASRARGAQLNETRIRVNDCPALDKATIGYSCAGKDNFSTLLRLQERLQGKVAEARAQVAETEAS